MTGLIIISAITVVGCFVLIYFPVIMFGLSMMPRSKTKDDR